MEAGTDISFLTRHALFGGLNEEAMAIVSTFLKRHTFPAETNIICENNVGDCLYFIVEGCVEIIKEVPATQTEPANKRVLANLYAGDAFGEMELIDSQSRSATVRAIEDVRLLSLSNKDLYQIHQKSPETFTMIILNLARELSRRLRKQDELLIQLNQGK